MDEAEKTEQKLADVVKYVKPKISMPLIKISKYKKEYDLCKIFCKDNNANSTEHYIIRPDLNKSKTYNYDIYEKNKEKPFLGFNEFAAVPSPMMNYEAHEKWHKAMDEVKEIVEESIGYFNE